MTRDRVLAAVLVLVGVLLVAAVVGVGGPSRPPPGPASPSLSRAAVADPPRDPREPPALLVLHRWDARRAAAYQAGGVHRLRFLYVAGSGAGRADVRVLRGYLLRGYRVAGMRTQVLALDVLASDSRRLEVQISDRLVGAVAVRGPRRLALPRDATSTRVVSLVRSAGGLWQVSAVRDAPAGAAAP